MRKPATRRNRIIPVLIFLLLLILCVLVLMGMPVGDSSDVVPREPNPSTLRYYSGQDDLRIGALPDSGCDPSTSSGFNPSGECPSNECVCMHYFSLLADELDRSETPFRTGEYEDFGPGPPATMQRNFVSSGIYLPLEMETVEGTAVIYTLVAYWLSPEGEVKEDLVALGVELPEGDERFFLVDPAVDDLEAARVAMKPGVVFTATLSGFVDKQGANWGDCPGSDFATQYGEQTCLIGAALAEGNPPDVSSGFTGSFLFGWQLERTGEVIPLPVCQYIEEM